MDTVAEISNRYLEIFSNLYSQLVPWMQKIPRNSKIYITIYNLGQNINGFKRELTGTTSATATRTLMLGHLVSIANELDQKGQHELADRMDQIIEKSRETVSIVNDLVEVADILDTNREFDLADILDKTAGLVKVANDFSFLSKEPRELEPIEPRHKGYLSSRYCPDHRGVQAMRIAENKYQCPIDGKVYPYDTGYKNYKGQIVPGGSVAKQTPETSNYGIPMRFYDSRQSVLKSMH